MINIIKDRFLNDIYDIQDVELSDSDDEPDYEEDFR